MNKKAKIWLILLIGLFLIITVPFFFVFSLKVVDKSIAGFYVPVLDFYVIKTNMYKDFSGTSSMSLTIDSAVHEYGHHVWYEILNNSQKKRWIELYEATADNGFVSSYAEVNYKEDFSETLAKSIICSSNINYIEGINMKKAKFIQEVFS